ncbi:hypothetical protein [Halopseudomonas bauzanensis]|uniref:hypothetical protein n=1 Tax=Halopseudomonas bauzanensis TaxID=653930 RepID=UPI00255704F5|nr:hypothetical protein [Halopseudomonas bauzanensis]
MALNIYGEPIPDLTAANHPAELPLRADGRPCNIYGDPIEDAKAVATKIQQLPSIPRHVWLVQDAVHSTFLTLGIMARYIADIEPCVSQKENDSEDGWRYGPAGHGLYIGGIRVDDDEL